MAKCDSDFVSSPDVEQRLLAFLAKKKIALVGNAPIECDRAAVDACDLVIRCNKYDQWGHEGRCDVWITSLWNEAIVNEVTLDRDQPKWIIAALPPPDQTVDAITYVHATTAMDRLKGYDIYFLPIDFRQELAAQMKKRPMTGFMVSMWMRSHQLDVQTFRFFSPMPNHFLHDPSAEELIFKSV